jgi:hypothetical protein
MAAMSWRSMRRMVDGEAMLRRMGLEQRSPSSDFFTGLGLFSIGVLVGAGLGLMFAPKRGEDMRQMVTEAIKNRRATQSGPDYQAMGAETAMPTAGTGH